jgi:hypothetical protein
MLELENMQVVLPLGACALGLTLFMVLSGKKEVNEQKIPVMSYEVRLFSRKIDVFMLAYAVIVAVLSLIGLAQHVLAKLVSGLLFAIIPIAASFAVKKHRTSGDANTEGR